MMADLYRLADVLLFPSRREGFGIPALEAGLARLPIFAADIPTLHAITGAPSGSSLSGQSLAHLFDPEGDPVAVADAIAAYLKSDPIYQMRRRVLGRFTWEMVLERRLIPIIQAAA
jgi:glycosyltransferase involved in cell wall biosynthesis